MITGPHCQTCTCGCTCGYGGFHEPENQRCELNQALESVLNQIGGESNE